MDAIWFWYSRGATIDIGAARQCPSYHDQAGQSCFAPISQSASVAMLAETWDVQARTPLRFSSRIGISRPLSSCLFHRRSSRFP